MRNEHMAEMHGLNDVGVQMNVGRPLFLFKATPLLITAHLCNREGCSLRDLVVGGCWRLFGSYPSLMVGMTARKLWATPCASLFWPCVVFTGGG